MQTISVRASHKENIGTVPSLLLRAIFGHTAIVTLFGAIAAQPFDATALRQVQEAGKTLLIDVTAPWCPTCTQQPPIIEQVEKEKPDFVVYEGACKLVHYVEREIQRSAANRGMPVVLPVPVDPGPQAPSVKPSGPAQRPAAGPVVPLTGAQAVAEELIGGTEEFIGGGRDGAEAAATRVLSKGEAIAAPGGRADDFSWPRGNALNAQPAVADRASASLSSPASTRSSKPLSDTCHAGLAGYRDDAVKVTSMFNSNKETQP
jgi:thiol-disulfide isomerase/thioredoxin